MAQSCSNCRSCRDGLCRSNPPGAAGWPAVKPDDWCAKWKDQAFVPLADGVASRASDALVLETLADLSQGTTQAKLIEAVKDRTGLSRNAVDHRLKKMLTRKALESRPWKGSPRTIWAPGEWAKRDIEEGDDAPVPDRDTTDYWTFFMDFIEPLFGEGHGDVARRGAMRKAALNNRRDVGTFARFLRHALRHGFLFKVDGSHGEYGITPEGREAWAKKRDFYAQAMAESAARVAAEKALAAQSESTPPPELP